MATIFTHPAVAISLSPLFGSVLQSKTILWAGIILTIVPDFDVVGLRLGIPYGHVFGHRGITHSLFFALIFSGLTARFITLPARTSFFQVWVYLFLCMASHGALDALTDGGHGIAFFSPFSTERYFFSFTPIEVSTLNITHFFQGQGLSVIKSELIWVWIPCISVFFLGLFYVKATGNK